MTMQIGEFLPSSDGVHTCKAVRGSRTRMRLTRRGKIVTGLLAATLCFAGLTVGVKQAESSIPPQQVTSYTVRPGETMWQYASDITPSGGDVNETIDKLMKLNNLHSTSLQAGERLIVPQQ
ncbi:LysM peptidoglycan-binding domain-containing protein [Bifidobacterium aquikefiricola]|uniref:LysM peptidoglycan-binding domain-containing protein n=1 Tax=Bifidobacterium aquikefiricola TaxID=3059038 RepID=A0AB39U8J9_9BIFI